MVMNKPVIDNVDVLIYVYARADENANLYDVLDGLYNPTDDDVQQGSIHRLFGDRRCVLRDTDLLPANFAESLRRYDVIDKSTKYVDIAQLCKGMLDHQYLDAECESYYETVASMLSDSPWTQMLKRERRTRFTLMLEIQNSLVKMRGHAIPSDYNIA